ncbi:MarR family winged helix-turn-helix transcriptional regulator [[Eubacterium] hominis]|uniref:MarR family winged helix-turn-helix transcriptional regulator n=1 Tax=[Eubacterium] hominis TaxID=2764325 RepID=UPI003A4E57F5
MSDVRIGFLIKQVYYMNQARLNVMFAEFDLTATQTFTLIYLFKAHEDGRIINQRDIERDLDISNPTVTGILNRLEHKGLILRKMNPADARVKNIVVTSEALELDKILRKKFQENEKQLVEVLSEEEVSELSRMLEKILSADI